MSQINQYLLNNIRTLEFLDFHLLFPYFMLFLPRILFPLRGCTPNIGHFPTIAVFLLCSLHILILIYMFTIFVHYSSLPVTSSMFNFLLPKIHQLVVLSVIKPFKRFGKYLIFPLLEQNSKLRMFFSQD